MKVFAVVALISALGWSAAIVAQDVKVDAGAAAGVTTDTAGASAVGSAGVTLSADLDSMDELTTHLSASASASLDLSAVVDATTIYIVKVSSLQASAAGNMDSFKAALTANASSLATLRSAVGANAAIKAKLEAEGYTADDVVAVVRNEADASITVYVDDSA